MKTLVLAIILCLSSIPVRAQSISVSKVALEGIDFSVTAEGLPDTSESAHLIFSSETISKTILVNVTDGKVDTTLILENTGNYNISLTGFPSAAIRIIPGILSILPPLIAIILALIFRQVLISLLFGIYIGVVFIYNYNPLTAILRLVDTEIVSAVNDESHIQILVFTFLFGGIIGLISKSGGTKGIANLITRLAISRRSTMISSWLSGVVIFFDDYANALIVGNLMRPITDKMRISREKLAFIVDSTSAPIASVFIISSWIGYEIGLIQDGLNIIGSNENAYEVFLQTIPYRFYPIAMLIFVFMIGWSKRDFGPMLKAEKRAAEENKVFRDGAKISLEKNEGSEMFGNDDKAKWYNGIIPIVYFIIAAIAGLVFTGISSLNEQGIMSYSVREVVGNSNSYLALMWASFTTCILAGIMILSQKIMTLSETIDAWFMGIRSMLFALIILVLAWSIGAITEELKTADYIATIISGSVKPEYLPVLVFIACALTSFSTGTSWGTMAIMMPIVIPLSDSVSSLNNLSLIDSTLILHGVISSVLTGAVFGDHCSPISDTTILSSLASQCDHIDHVKTQLPYAILTAGVCMLIGDIPTAFGFSPYLSILIISGILGVILFVFGKRTDYNLPVT
ncbi:MAG: Na+/H+ antiporter NhaC family protein [Ignavibacteriaceae bacterium]